MSAAAAPPPAPLDNAEKLAVGAQAPRIPLTLGESFMIGGLAGCAAVSVSESLSRRCPVPSDKLLVS